MINEIETWRQNREWIEQAETLIETIHESEPKGNAIRLALGNALAELNFVWSIYGDRIKSRETLKAQLEASLSQATGGKE